MTKVTMQDIANHLGISKNSVSQALRDKKGVSDATKKEVLAAATALGYHYAERAATQLHFILFATEFALSQTSFFGEIVKSIQHKCSNINAELTIQEIRQEHIDNLTVPVDLLLYDGIIVLSHSDNRYIKILIDSQIPTIIVDHHDPLLAADAILTKNTDGVFSAVSLLHHHHYQTIGFIGDISFSPSYLERYRGFKRALEHFDLPFSSEFIITEIEESQGALFTKLNQLKTQPDAWFCANSGLAFMLNSYLQSKGLVIPKDIAIICFDNTEFTRMSQPKITNVATDLTFMGELAVETLQERMNNRSVPYVHKQIVPSMNIYESI